MQTLQANATTGFTWFHSQETGKRRSRSGWQTGLLLQSASSHGLWAHHAALSGFDRALSALCRRLRGGVGAVADRGHDHRARLPPRNRCRRAAQCVSMAASITRAVECPPQFVASTAIAGHTDRRGASSRAFAAIDIDIRASIAALWTAALRGVSVAIASLVFVTAFAFVPSNRPAFVTLPSFSPMSNC